MSNAKCQKRVMFGIWHLAFGIAGLRSSAACSRIELMSEPSKDRITEDDSPDSPARP
jgi:hypothetical protein